MAFVKDLTVRSVPCVTFKDYEHPKKVTTAYFNSALCEEVGVNHMKYCELYFDAEQQLVGFHFTELPGSASRKMQKGRAFPVSSFVKANNIEHVAGNTYELTQDKTLELSCFFSCNVSNKTSNPAA